MFGLIFHTDLFAVVACAVMAAAVASARSFADAVIGSEIRQQASITVLYSEPGDGKTYLMSEFEGAFFLPLEDGTAGFSPEYKVRFFAQPAKRQGAIPVPIIPRTYAEFVGTVRRFIAVNVPPAGERVKPFGYLMIDGLTPLEALVHAETCRRADSSSMEDKFGMWTASLAVWAEVWALLEEVRGRGVHVWIAAHAADEPAATIAGETYRRKTIRMLTGGNKNAPDFAGMLFGRVDNLWFLARDVSVTPGARGRRAAARYGGRVIYTQPTREIGGASYRAKSRRTMPAKIPATPIDIRRAQAAGIARPADKVLADLMLVLPTLPDAERGEIEREIPAVRDKPNLLARLLSRAQGIRAAQEDDDAPEGDEGGELPEQAQQQAPAQAPPAQAPPAQAPPAQAPPAQASPAPEDDYDDTPADVPGATPAPVPPPGITVDLDPIVKAPDAASVTRVLEAVLGRTPLPALRSAILFAAFSRLMDLAKTAAEVGRASGLLEERIKQGEYIDPAALESLRTRIAERRAALGGK